MKINVEEGVGVVDGAVDDDDDDDDVVEGGRTSRVNL